MKKGRRSYCPHLILPLVDAGSASTRNLRENHGEKAELRELIAVLILCMLPYGRNNSTGGWCGARN